MKRVMRFMSEVLPVTVKCHRVALTLEVLPVKSLIRGENAYIPCHAIGIFV